jgi:hypothetical protein
VRNPDTLSAFLCNVSSNTSISFGKRKRASAVAVRNFAGIL